MKNKFYIGTDIGGTTFSSSLFNHNHELVSKSSKNYIKNYDNQNDLLNSITDQITKLTNNKSIIGVGIACPGPLNAKDGKILDTPNLKLLQNCNLKREIQNRLGIQCEIENDANLFALGEYKNTIEKPEIFVGVTLGTGLGFGIVINGKLFTGGNGMAAEFGISPNYMNTWEENISIRWIESQINKYELDSSIEPKELTLMGINLNKKAIAIWKEFGFNLGICLSNIINLLDPNEISIGGGLSGAFSLFEETMVQVINANSPSFRENNIKIYESQNKEKSAMLGASMLFKN